MASTMVEEFGEIERISGTLKMVNDYNRHVAFQVKMTHPNLFCASPNIGIIKPHTTFEVSVKRQAQDVVAPLPEVFAEEKFLIERSFVPEDTCVEQIAPFFSSKCKDDIVIKRYVFVDATPKAETRSETKEEDLKMKEAQRQIVLMNSEIEKLRIQLNKAEKTISEPIRRQAPMPSCCFLKCFNFK